MPETHVLFHLGENKVLDSNTHILLNYQQRHNGLFFCIHKRQKDCGSDCLLRFRWITTLLSFKSEDWFLPLSLTILESKRRGENTSSGAVIFAEKNLLQNINQIFRLLGNHMAQQHVNLTNLLISCNRVQLITLAASISWIFALWKKKSIYCNSFYKTREWKSQLINERNGNISVSRFLKTSKD